MSNPTSQPSSQPSRQPSLQPSLQPSNQPSSQPSNQPSRQPSLQPSQQPSLQPSRQPSNQPSSTPTNPTSQPSSQPSRQPSRQPSSHPSRRLPTSYPTTGINIPAAKSSPATSSMKKTFLLVIGILMALIVAAIFIWRWLRKRRSGLKNITGQRGDAYQGHRGGYGGRSVPNTTPTTTPRKRNQFDEEQISPLAHDQVGITINNNKSNTNTDVPVWKAFDDNNDPFGNSNNVRTSENRNSRKLNGPQRGSFNKPMINIKNNPMNAAETQIPMIPLSQNKSPSLTQQSFPTPPSQQQRARNTSSVTDSLLIINDNDNNGVEEHEDDHVMF